MKRSKNVPLSAAFAATIAATLALTGCSDDGDGDGDGTEYQTYCATEQDRKIVDPQYCDGEGDDDDDFDTFIYMGNYGSRYNVGQSLPMSKGGVGERKVSPMNSAQRTSAGLPARGGFGGNGSKLSVAG